MDFEWSSTFQPSVSKACARCHARKVKCDQKVPRCTACLKHNEECNITECVAYPYAVVHRLQNEIQNLKARLQAFELAPAAPLPENQAFLSTTLESPQTRQVTWSLGKEAEEVGSLAIGGSNPHSEYKYIGSAAGSTFVRIFFKQLNLTMSRPPPSNGSSLERCPSEQTAALPPRPTANFLLTKYIARVHIWWPFLQLPGLRRSFQSIYQNPRKCHETDKFIVFAVLALASSECQEDTGYQALMDLNEPESYYETALRFFKTFYDHPRDLFGIQAVLLLTLWMLNSDTSSHCNDLWHLSRYLMSAAIEAGFHRHNADWGFSAEEVETRNRTWWCIYNLERQVAVVTGRVLSIRDHAIHALQPAHRSFDALSPNEARETPIFHKHNILLCRLVTRLRQISGRILESVYIGRGPDGKALATSFQQICAASDACRLDLESWKQELLKEELKPSREYSELKIEYCLLQLLLNRPSPTFMVPSNAMITVCSKSVSSAVGHWSGLDSHYGISAVCRCFRQLHAILVVGLAGLYCDWQFLAATRDVGQGRNMSTATRHWEDTNTCLKLLRRSLDQLKMPGFTRYYDLLQVVRNKVYIGSSTVNPPTQSSLSVSDSYNMLSTGSMSYDREPGPFFSGEGDIDMYMNQVSSFFDEGMMNRDETLNAWYDAVMEEIQPSQGG